MSHDPETVQRRCLVVGAAGVLACGVGGLFDPPAFFRAWAVAYLFCLQIALGCMAILMLHYLSGGSWGIVIRRIAESAIGTLPVLALLFVPLAVGVPTLFVWARPEAMAADPILQQKHAYLNVPFFLVRAVCYFVAWIAVARLLDGWSRARDVAPDPNPRRFRLISGPGLVVYGLTVTFAAIDWGMSLEPHWYSTVYPLAFGVGQVLSGFAFAIAVAILLAGRDPFGRLVTGQNLIDLGNLLLTFVLLWAYLAFAQFMLIWAANLREEVTYYLPREHGGWRVLAGTLIAFHFALPFALLLVRRVKRSPPMLAGVALVILGMRLVDLFWLVLPGLPGAHGFHWLYVVAPVGVGALWLGAFVSRLRGHPLVPGNDPAVEEAMAHAL